jgi:hypothetical protein
MRSQAELGNELRKSLGDTTPLVVDQPQDPRWDPSQAPAAGKAKAKKAK